MVADMLRTDFKLTCSCPALEDSSRKVATWLKERAATWSIFASFDHFVASYTMHHPARLDHMRIFVARALRKFEGATIKLVRAPCEETISDLIADDTYVLIAHSRTIGNVIDNGSISTVDAALLREQVAQLQEELGRMNQVMTVMAATVVEATRTSTTHNTTNSNNITTTNLIVINDFGKEDLSFMQSPEDLMKLRHNGVIKAIRQIHFNCDHAENQNVRLRSLKQAMVEVVQNGRWMPRCMTSVTDEIIRRAYDMITRRFVLDVDYREEMMDACGDGLMEWHMQMLSAGHEMQVAMTPIRRDLKALMVSNRTGSKHAPIAFHQ